MTVVQGYYPAMGNALTCPSSDLERLARHSFPMEFRPFFRRSLERPETRSELPPFAHQTLGLPERRWEFPPFFRRCLEALAHLSEWRSFARRSLVDLDRRKV